MNYKLTRLPNGLRVISVPMPSLESATVTIWVRTGSRNETAKLNGISHFLEHMVFKGSAKRPTAKLIAEAVDAIGGSTNASTGKEWTNFYIKVRNTHLETAFDVLSDMVLNPLIPDKELQQEKGVIVEEIGMYEDTPQRRIGDIYEQLFFKGHPLGRDIIGTPETVTAFSVNDFQAYRDKYYFGDNMLVSVAGGVTDAKVLALAKKYFSGVKSGKQGAQEKFAYTHTKPLVRLYEKQKEQAHFIMGFPAGPGGNKDSFVEAVISTILGGGMSSRMFTEIREKRGLAYAVHTDVEYFVDTGYLETYAGVDPKRVDDAIRVMREQYLGLASKQLPVTAPELAKAKEYLKGHYAYSLESTGFVGAFFAIKELMREKILTPEQVFKAIDKVTLADVQRVAAKLIQPEKLSLAIIGPYTSATRFEKLVN